MQTPDVHPHRANLTEVTFRSDDGRSDVSVTYSYREPVVLRVYGAAFGKPGDPAASLIGWHARRNDWGPTTGRHIAESLPQGASCRDKSERIDGDEMGERIRRALAELAAYDAATVAP